jgi:hypothetical protein
MLVASTRLHRDKRACAAKNAAESQKTAAGLIRFPTGDADRTGAIAIAGSGRVALVRAARQRAITVSTAVTRSQQSRDAPDPMLTRSTFFKQ